MQAPRFSDQNPITFGDVQYQLIITNAGSTDAFVASQIVAQRLTVESDSSAKMQEEVLKSPRLRSGVDRLHWRAAGQRPYASPIDHAGSSSHQGLPAGAWSFTPQGAPVTFARVRTFPTSPQTLSHELNQSLSSGPSMPPAALRLREDGFLLAAAPLTRATRKALLETIGSLPGIHICGAVFPKHVPPREAFCVNGNPTDAEILINAHTGVAVVVCERLDKPTPLYPNMGVGALVSSYTFSLQPSL
jgi:hypothetical protein